jgi:FlaG/FlaF family flagellin (archaellin)
MKMLKKVFGSKRAFSAVIASLILMLLAVAAGVVVYAYVMGWIGSATSNPKQTGHLTIDSIYANASSGTIKIYVRNVGGSNLLLSKIYVEGNDVANDTSAIPDSGVSLPVQGVAFLNISYPSMIVNRFYPVQVTCKDGTTVSLSAQAQ